MRKKMQVSIAALLVITGLSAVAFAWLFREPIIERELHLGGANEHVVTETGGVEIKFTAYALFRGTSRQLALTKNSLEENSRMLSMLSQQIASQATVDLWFENDLASLQDEFLHGVREQVGNGTIVAFGFEDYDIASSYRIPDRLVLDPVTQ